MKRHSKTKNVGIVLEVLNTAVSNLAVADEEKRANKLFAIVRKHYLNEDSYIREVYSKVYAPALYGQTKNNFFASRFLRFILDEYKNIDQARLNKEINVLLREIDSVSSRKQLFANKINNYKLFASLKQLGDNSLKTIQLTPVEKIQCEQVVIEHFVDNEEFKRISEGAENLEPNKSTQEDQYILQVAFRKFKERYSQRLTEEQNNCMIKYLMSPNDRVFSRWVEKKMRVLVNEIDNKLFDENMKEDSRDKLRLVREKYNGILEEKTFVENMTDVLLSFELKDMLQHFHSGE